ncbi:hypothetical protein QU926_27460 [Pseudomonas asiatica]|uniref:hypothetical protein n=1 Tax=Pseudomonas asiatica TaxID=2219225 RepID=UPI0025AAB112|nr:hypothetical protein [Pseudomonas asiatica]MDM9557357.1 hypothetical protein [Pseudomonas asiatica]
MKAIRLLRSSSGKPVLVLELPRRGPGAEALVVSHSGLPWVPGRVLRFSFEDPAVCTQFVQGFDRQDANDVVGDRSRSGALHVS